MYTSVRHNKTPRFAVHMEHDRAVTEQAQANIWYIAVAQALLIHAQFASKQIK